MANVTRPTRLNLSRREFTRGAAMAAATAVVPKPGLGDAPHSKPEDLYRKLRNGQANE